MTDDELRIHAAQLAKTLVDMIPDLIERFRNQPHAIDHIVATGVIIVSSVQASDGEPFKYSTTGALERCEHVSPEKAAVLIAQAAASQIVRDEQAALQRMTEGQKGH